MTALHLRSTFVDAGVTSVDANTASNYFGVIGIPVDTAATFTHVSFCFPVSPGEPVGTERAFEYAVTHYDHLLRRLAD